MTTLDVAPTPASDQRKRLEAIAVMASEGLPVEVACRVLCVSCAGFYARRFRPPSARAVQHAWLTDVIREVHTASYANYGAKRVHAELVLGRGIRVGHNAVAMLMQRAAIVGRSGARKRYGIPSAASADDLVDRMFVRDPTSCGLPTSPSIRLARARCTAPSCLTRSAAASSAGRSAATQQQP